MLATPNYPVFDIMETAHCSVQAKSAFQREVQVLGIHADSTIQSPVHISHHNPWMQSQGKSNYCGLCAINNAYSDEKLTVEQLDNIADDLWLRQLEQFSLDLTDELQIQRDVNGFYSFEVLREVVECFGDQLLNLNELVQKPLTFLLLRNLYLLP